MTGVGSTMTTTIILWNYNKQKKTIIGTRPVERSILAVIAQTDTPCQELSPHLSVTLWVWTSRENNGVTLSTRLVADRITATRLAVAII